MGMINRTVVRNGAHYWVTECDAGPTVLTPGWDFWSAFGDHWEAHLEDVLSRCLDKDSTMIDIGAWIGPVSIIASRMCRKVHAFEPDPVAFEYLVGTAGRQRRKNISVYPYAVSPFSGKVTLGTRPGCQLGDSMTSPWVCDGGETIEVDAITPSGLVDMIGIDSASLDLVKIDVEGMEELILEPLLAELAKLSPVKILLSTHGLLIADEAARQSYIDSMTSVLDGLDVERISGTWEGLGTVLVTVA